MNKKIFIRTMAIGAIFFITFLSSEKIRSIENTSAETKVDALPKITRTDAKVIKKTVADNRIEEAADSSASTGADLKNKKDLVHENKMIIDGVPHISQLPELERGCEVTSLTMLIQSQGIAADKLTLAKQIHKLPFRDANYVRSNPYDGFVGDIYTFSKSGYGVYHGPVAKLAEKYLPGKINDVTGQTIDSVYSLIDSGSPVWVITNSTFAPLPESEFTVWDTNTGKVKITYSEHSVLIVGYDGQSVYINDPLADTGYKAVPRIAFEQAWVQMGSQAIGVIVIK
ncbi:C39 family peptidase [Heyndrickxia sp. MSNUG]|uniref:C39 family peptidase n=1 Tax=Heyndrickxia sp. MSNUG TaxID=3136677 RepID=UPI003C2BFB48